MGYGGYHPYPRRFGGGKPSLQVIHDGLNAQRGDAFNPVDGSVVSIENMAFARAICFDGWGTNARLANQWDPRTTTDMLRRWERIFGIRPDSAASESERRTELTRRWRRFGRVSNHAAMETELGSRLGSFFVAIEYISLANAFVASPDNSYPWGVVLTRGGTWSSTVAHILVLLQKPPGSSEGEFYDAAAKVYPVLDALAPAWATFDWYRAPDPSLPISVLGGPSMGGFYLDQEHNLDNHVLDV